MCDVRRQSTMRADRTAGAAITRSNEEPKRSMSQCEWNPPNLRQRMGVSRFDLTSVAFSSGAAGFRYNI
jgi:hypothetical protein